MKLKWNLTELFFFFFVKIFCRYCDNIVIVEIYPAVLTSCGEMNYSTAWLKIFFF